MYLQTRFTNQSLYLLIGLVALVMLGSCGKNFNVQSSDLLTKSGQTEQSATQQPLSSTLKMSSNSTVNCALHSQQGLKCWGSNANRLLGIDVEAHIGDEYGEMGSHLARIDLGGVPVQIAVGGQSACALLSDNTVKCWGNNSNGELGQGNIELRANISTNMGNNLPATPIGASGTVTKIAAGYNTYCAVMLSGGLRCWGGNSNGQLGLGHTQHIGDEPGEMAALTDIPLGGQVLDVSIGFFHVCALLSGGTVKCWGQNLYGQLGLGHTNAIGDNKMEINNLSALQLGTGLKALALGVGHYHNCVLLNNGGVKCWGYGAAGQLGNGHTNHIGDGEREMGNNLPVIDIGSHFQVSQLFVGNSNVCVVSRRSQLKCWGDNRTLGHGDRGDQGDAPNKMGNHLPIISLGINTGSISAVSSGYYHTCATFSTLKVKCWGTNTHGVLGIGDRESRGNEPGQMGDSLPYVGLGFASALSN